MVLCESAMIHSFGYDAQAHQLFVRFVHGRKLYRYDSFPEDQYQSMREAVSPGKFFSQRVVKIYQGEYIKESD